MTNQPRTSQVPLSPTAASFPRGTTIQAATSPTTASHTPSSSSAFPTNLLPVATTSSSPTSRPNRPSGPQRSFDATWTFPSQPSPPRNAPSGTESSFLSTSLSPPTPARPARPARPEEALMFDASRTVSPTTSSSHGHSHHLAVPSSQGVAGHPPTSASGTNGRWRESVLTVGTDASFDSAEEVDLATMVMMRNPSSHPFPSTSGASSTPLSGGAGDAPTVETSAGVKRIPVPALIDSSTVPSHLPHAKPSAVEGEVTGELPSPSQRTTATTPTGSGARASRSPEPRGSRLSLSGFEALLAPASDSDHSHSHSHSHAHSANLKDKGKAKALEDVNEEVEARSREAFSPRVSVKTTPKEKEATRFEDGENQRARRRADEVAEERRKKREAVYFPLPLDNTPVRAPGMRHLRGTSGGEARLSGRSPTRSFDGLAERRKSAPLSNARGITTATALPRDNVMPWRRSSVARDTSKSLEEVVVHSPDGDDDGEKDAWLDDDEAMREALFRSERMNFRMITFSGWFPRLIHWIYPLFIFVHFPATLFLDYNVLYILAQLALDPSFPSTSSTSSLSLFTRSLDLDIPTVNVGTAYWVALGVYAACTAVWGLVVCLWHDFIKGYIRMWEQGQEVPLEQIYSGAASFNYGCIKSYSYFSLLWRVRLAPFQSHSAVKVQGSTWVDGLVETCAWYSQNWPTILLLLPRAGLSLALLFLFDTTAYGSSSPEPMTRDTGYFEPNGMLTSYATGVLLANCAWSAWRLAVIASAFFGLALFGRPFENVGTKGKVVIPPSGLSLGDDRRRSAPWRTRRRRRLRYAILLCSRSSPSSTPAPSHRARSQHSKDQRMQSRAEREDRRRRQLAESGAEWNNLHSDGESDHLSTRDAGGWGFITPYILPSPPLSYKSSKGSQNSAEDVPTLSKKFHLVSTEEEPAPLRRGRRGSLPAIASQAHEKETSRANITALPLSTAPPITFPPHEPSASALSSVRVRPEDVLSRPWPLFSAFSTSTSIAPQSTLVSPMTSPRNSRQDIPDLRVSAPSNETSSPQSPSSAAPLTLSALSQALQSPDDKTTTTRAVFQADLQAARADLVERTTAQNNWQRHRLSQRLLEEVQRNDELEARARDEERRLAGLSRISEVSNESRSNWTDATRGSVPARDDDTFLLPPFRLSYDSRDSSGHAFEFDESVLARRPGEGDIGSTPISPEIGSELSTPNLGGWSPALAQQSDDDDSRTPTQRWFSRSTGITPSRHTTLHLSPGADTFGETDLNSAVSSPKKHGSIFAVSSVSPSALA